jgi:virginiamycin B lyase
MAISSGKVYFAELTGNKVGRLDPSTNQITEWDVPTSGSWPREVAVYGGKVWFNEELSNKIGKLFPTGGTVTNVTPVSNSVSHPVTKKTPTATKMKPTTTTVTPTDTYVGPSTSGQFAEWTVPTAGGDPYNIAAPGGGEVWFTEAYGFKIGRLS